MSSRVAQGSLGCTSFFSLFLSLLFCLKIFFFNIVGLRAEDLVIGFRRNLKYVQYSSMLVFSLRNKGHIIVMIFIGTYWFLTRGLMPS